MSAINGLHRPALESLTQQIVAREDLPKFAALNSVGYGVSMVAGPAAGGLIIAHFGLITTFSIDFLSFLISLIALSLLKNIPKPTSDPDQSVLSSLLEGFSYVIKKQALLGSYAVDFAAMIFGMPSALFPAIAVSFGGAKTLGLLYAAPAVGALLISIFSAWTLKIKRHGLGISYSAACWGIAIIGFGLSHNLYLALFFLAIAGAADAVSGIFRQTLWNHVIPENYRGRLAGIEMISYMSGPKLGDTEAALVAAAFGISTSIISGGILCVIGVGLCCYFLPTFRKYSQTD
jgi:MFS family permease